MVGVERYNAATQEGRCAIPRPRASEPTVIPDNPNWHRFKTACPFYRERWSASDEELGGHLLLYQVICLQNMPPETLDQQEQCMEARTTCWRLRVSRRARTA